MTDIVIPDEAVEAAAKAIYETPHDGLSRAGYERAERGIQDLYRAEACSALVAALPAIRRQILTEAIEGIRAEDWWTREGGSEYDIGDNDGKVRVIGWLDDRIAEIDGAG